MIKWIEKYGGHFGVVGGKELYEIYPTCGDKGFWLTQNIGKFEMMVRDEKNGRMTLDQAKDRCESMFKTWFDLVGGGNG